MAKSYKKFAKENFRGNELEIDFQKIRPTKKCKFNDECWKTESKNGKVFVIDFTQIRKGLANHHAWVKEIGIDPIILAKILFLKTIPPFASESLQRSRFQMIVKTIIFFANSNVYNLSKLNLYDYLLFVLSTIFDSKTGQVIKLLTPISYSYYLHGVRIDDWSRALKLFGIKGIGFTVIAYPNFMEQTLKKVIEDLTSGEIAFGDWKKGGNFNNLGLDYGRYYIEHCSTFFSCHKSLAKALTKTKNNLSVVIERCDISRNNKGMKSFILPLMGHLVIGKKYEELPKNYRTHYSKNIVLKIQRELQIEFQNNFRQISLHDNLLSKDVVNRIFKIDTINQKIKTEIEFSYLVEIIYDVYFDQNSDCNDLELKTIWLLNHREQEVIQVVRKKLELVRKNFSPNEMHSIPTVNFYKQIGIKKTAEYGSTYLVEFLKLVEYCGLISFMALTGWRSSEYGFSLSDIRAEMNEDILDQDYFPIRYIVRWKIPKTHGQQNVDREISQCSFNIAKNLAELNLSQKYEPCLYSTKFAKNPSKTSYVIKRGVTLPWEHFCLNYPPFKYMDKKDNFRDPLLYEAYKKVQTERDRIIAFRVRKKPKKLIENYINGSLKQPHLNLLNKHLSKETKEKLHSIDFKTNRQKHHAQSVVSEILGDCVYPTPHSFRHIWAEAVFRRFDGDAGWMIRSNFKHINRNMWHNYVEGKSNQWIKRTKRKVISSLLNNYLLKEGRAYAGPMEKKLRRIVAQTRSANHQDLARIIRSFGDDEITDIKSTEWGYCLLNRRTMFRAKCAEGRVPQRHNASPALCLGCCNNLAQSGNVSGILLGISNDIEVLKNSKVPQSFRLESHKTVSTALNYLLKLDAESEVIQMVELVLKNYRKETRN